VTKSLGVVDGSRRFNRSEIQKNPAEKSGNIILFFGFHRKQILARGGCGLSIAQCRAVTP
jgi:hypothetical protein